MTRLMIGFAVAAAAAAAAAGAAMLAATGRRVRRTQLAVEHQLAIARWEDDVGAPSGRPQQVLSQREAAGSRDQWMEDMRTCVKERPLTTIGVTAVVALLIGRFWAK